ncbi:VWA domain-containing protein, partial [bacterium]|nr:VWA domain-containing protein [bacterium]
MLSRLLGLKELGHVSHLEFYLRHRWPAFVALIFIVAAIAVVAAVYRRELGVSKRRRTLLGLLRVCLYTVIIVLIFEPVLGIERAVTLRKSVLVLVDVSESMGTTDERKSREELLDAALALGHASFEKPSVPIARNALSEVAAATRLDLARSVLDHPELDAFDRIAREHKLRLLSFGETVAAVGRDEGTLTDSLAKLRPTAKATRLGSAIEEAVARYGGQAIAAVVVLTDGASNEGLEPDEAARRLRERGIPLFPVGIGLPHQPDVRIQSVVAQEAVFPGDEVPVRVQVDATGFAGRTAVVTVTLDGDEVARKAARLTDGASNEGLEPD